MDADHPFPPGLPQASLLHIAGCTSKFPEFCLHHPSSHGSMRITDACTTAFSFYVASMDRNGGPHTCVASA